MPHLFDRMPGLSRRRFVKGVAAGGMLATLGASRSALTAGSTYTRNGPETLRGNRFSLDIGAQFVNFTGREKLATTINQSLPAPTLRWREGEDTSETRWVAGISFWF